MGNKYRNRKLPWHSEVMTFPEKCGLLWFSNSALNLLLVHKTHYAEILQQSGNLKKGVQLVMAISDGQ